MLFVLSRIPLNQAVQIDLPLSTASESPNPFPKSPPDDEKRQLEFFRLLSVFEAGTVTISVNNFPLAKIDGETKTLDVELSGVREAGLKLGDFIESEGADGNPIEAIKRSSKFARNLKDDGWSLRVYEGDSSVLTMGRGVSSLTGFVWLNPLKLGRLLGLT